jgi:hypothetical protein
MEITKIKYSIYGNCWKISNGKVEAIITVDLGPRIIYYGFCGKSNMLAELDESASVEHEFGTWHCWGGHRFWHAPESLPRTYMPDDKPVKITQINESTLQACCETEPNTGIQKELTIVLAEDSTQLTVAHTLTNHNMWPIDIAPWAITVVAPGGTTIIPNEPFIPHSENLLPARPMVLWHYTNLADTRWKFGQKYTQLKCDGALDYPQKAGFANKQCWAGYLKDKTMFIKTFDYIEDAPYTDGGCNFETFTKGTFMEVESLAPLYLVETGESESHVENWYLYDGVETTFCDDSLDEAIKPLLEEIGEF